MATEATYVEQYSDSKATPTTRGVNKRKRGTLDSAPEESRAAPTARRSPAQYTTDFTAGESSATSHNAPTTATNAEDNGGFSADDQHQFDLSALQAHTASPANGAAHGSNTGGQVDTAAAALSQHYNVTVPGPAEEAFMQQPSAVGDYAGDGNSHDFSIGDKFGNASGSPDRSRGGMTANMIKGTDMMKPAVGSEEWHTVRKNNHKEVERRRRETINEGINELAKIVPGCEKNKGHILQRAVQYIQTLRDDSAANIDKWTFEKLITEQAIAEVSIKLDRTWAEKEIWKRMAKEAGVDVEAHQDGVNQEVETRKTTSSTDKKQTSAGAPAVSGDVGDRASGSAAAESRDETDTRS